MKLQRAFQRLCANWPELGAFAGSDVVELSSLEPDAVRGRLEQLRALAGEAEDREDATLLAQSSAFFELLFESGHWKRNPDVLSDWSALLLRQGLLAENNPLEAARLAEWLNAMPRALRDALADRDAPHPRALELAREGCAGLRDQLDALADLVPPTALQAALFAVGQHAQRLAELRAVDTPASIELAPLLRARGIPETADELAAMFDDEIARLVARSTDAASRDDAGLASPDLVRDALRTELELTQALWAAAGLPTASVGFEVLPVPPGLESTIPHAAVFSPRPLQPREPALVVLNSGSELARDGARRLLLAVHEGGPGHAVQAARANAVHRPWRAVDLCPIPGLGAGLFAGELMEGWAHFAESRYAELFAHLPGLQQAVVREALWRAARARADLGFGRGEWTAEQAAGFLERTAGLSVRDALAEVDDFRLNPTYGLSYTYGRLAIERLRRSSGLAEGVLYARLLDRGLAPISGFSASGR